MSGIEFEEEDYIPISRRPEWADVTPNHIPSVPDPVVHIAADTAHLDLMAYFWAGVNAEEVSQRMVDLTEEIILEFNSAHYSVWEYRWRCVVALRTGSSQFTVARSASEIALMCRVVMENPKNYQLWNYRRRFALARGADHWLEESEFSTGCLEQDAKNYHAWAHRQATALAFACSELWKKEFELTERFLGQDMRNNSAWNHRIFALRNAPQAVLVEGGHCYDSEVGYVTRVLGEAPHNEAAWEYLRGLCRLSDAPLWAFVTDSRIKQACCAALCRDPANQFPLVLLADCYVCRVQLLRIASLPPGLRSREESLKAQGVALRTATALFERAVAADPIRESYYRHRQRELASVENTVTTEILN